MRRPPWLLRLARGLSLSTIRSRRARPRPRLLLESLEDRTLLTAWTPLGPAPLPAPANENYAGNTFSGRITGIAADPHDANTIYVATAGGGIWKTTNAQSSSPTWTPLTDNVPGTTDSMGAIAVAPSNSQVLYAGTGEANNSTDSNYGEGILVSTDGGSSWTLENPGGTFTGKTVSKLVVAPNNPNIAYAAIADAGVNGQSGNTGIYKTTDGGVTWTNMTASWITGAAAFSDLVIDPSQPNTLYAAIGSPSGDPTNGIYESQDAGVSWTELTKFPHGSTVGRISLAIAPTNPEWLYAAASDPATNQLQVLELSINGGSGWINLANAPAFPGAQGFYDLSVTVDPTNYTTAYIGGSAVLANGRPVGAVYESTNGGSIWTLIGTDDTGAGVHADVHTLAFDANHHLLLGGDGGIYRQDSDPNNANGFLWTNLNGNLNTIPFYSVALNPADANQALGGSQGNGVSLYNNTAWSQVLGGDGGIVRYSQQDANLVYAANAVSSFGMANFFQVSTNGGATWSPQTTGLHFDSEASNFIPAFAVAPNDGTRIALGSTNIYLGSTEATSGNVAWTEITTVNANGWDPAGSPVDAIALGGDGKTIYASVGGQSASSSRIFVSTDDGATWTEGDLPAGSGRVNQLLVDPNNPQTAYAVVSTFGGGHVFKTTNGGAAWTDISGNLPNLPTWTIQLDAAGNVLYVGNDNGVYSSTDNGVTWSRFGDGLPNAQVFDLSFSPTLNLLGAATHGRGLWEIATGSSTPQNTSITVANVATTYTSAGQTVTLTANVAASGNPVTEGQVVFTLAGTGLGPVTATLSAGNPGVATATITLPATLNQGTYTIDASYTDPDTPVRYKASNGSGTLTVQTAKSATSATATNSPIAYNSGGETLDLQATITSTNGGPVNEGVVVFTVNGVSSTPIVVTSGTATMTLNLPAASVLTAGAYPSGILVNYSDTATNNYAVASATAGFTVVPPATVTTITSTTVSTTYNSTTDQTVTLNAAVASSNGSTINEGVVTFIVTNPHGVNLTATGNVNNGTATATLTVPAGFAAGSYSFSASYTDTPNANYAASTAATAGTLTVQTATTTTTITSTNVGITYNSTNNQTVMLTAAVASVNGDIVNEGNILFTVLNPNGTNLTALVNVSAGTATATLTVPAGFLTGSYTFSADYTDTKNANGVMDYNASTAPMLGTLTVQTAATTTTITAPNVGIPYNSINDQTVTLTASIASRNGGAVNEGSITFIVTNPHGVNLTATGSVNDGTAAVTLTVPASFAAGTYSFSASYADTPNANYAASMAATMGTLTVQSAATITTVTSPKISITYNSANDQTVTLSAAVASANSGTVNEGAITFTVINPNGVNLTTTATVSAGTATTTLTIPAGFLAGSYTLEASYIDTPNSNGIANYAASTATAPSTLTVNAAATQTIITSTAVSSAYNSTTDQMATLTASVASIGGGTVNEGTVTFTVTNPHGVNLTATATVSEGAATAMLTVPAGFAAGTYSFSASYLDTKNVNGVTNYNVSTVATPGMLAVQPAATITTITSPKASITYSSANNQTVTLTATIAGANEDTVNEGKVLFTVFNPNGVNLNATGNVNNGTATATLTVPAGFLAGSYTLDASYVDTPNSNGVANYGTSTTTAPGTLTVSAPATQTTITSPVVSITYNSAVSQTVTLTASVASTGGGTVNGGTVAFTVTNPHGINLTATGNVNNGTATAILTVPAGFAAGTYSFSASYADARNANYPASTAATMGTMTVQTAASQIGVALTVRVVGFGLHGRRVMVTATVTSSNGGTVNEGSVTFTINGVTLVTVAVNSAGQAVAILPLPPGLVLGGSTLTAHYADGVNANGTINFAASSGEAGPRSHRGHHHNQHADTAIPGAGDSTILAFEQNSQPGPRSAGPLDRRDGKDKPN